MGASSGIGCAVARRLIERGWKVAVAARRIEPLLQLRELAPDRVVAASIDITAEDAPQKLMALLEETMPAMYLHSSGVGNQNPALDPTIESATIQVNAQGFVAMIDTVFNHFKTHGGGHIAAITSVAGIRPLGQSPCYSATKIMQTAYLDALEQISHRRGHGITFTDIKPGYVRTPLLSKDDSKYFMMMTVDKVADDIVETLCRRRRFRIIDWRYRLLVVAGHLVPKCIWQRLPIVHID